MNSTARGRKPSTSVAMRRLIDEIRNAMPFDTAPAELCAGPCRGCPKKLLEYLDLELCEHQECLEAGEQPSLGDIQQLARLSRKVYRSLERNGLVCTRQV